MERDSNVEYLHPPYRNIPIEAKKYKTISFDDVLQKRLGVMDASAIALARDNNLPIIVFSLNEPGGFKGILSGKGSFTMVESR